MESLERLLTANRKEVEVELEKAEAELESLRAREQALVSLIARARSALGLGGSVTMAALGVPADQPRMLLHEAIAHVLREHGNAPKSARELADEVNQLGLYRKGDGTPVQVSQIHARVHNYPRMFVRDAGRIRLRDAELQVHDAELLARFDSAMLGVYEAAMREVGYPARRFLYMIGRSGGLDAARHLLAKTGISEGFRSLAEAGKLTLTMEYQVLRPEFRSLFSDEERATARKRLFDHGLAEANLPQ